VKDWGRFIVSREECGSLMSGRYGYGWEVEIGGDEFIVGLEVFDVRV
jgi:hypothetical protein